MTDEEDTGAEAEVEIEIGNIKEDEMVPTDIENHTEKNTGTSDQENVHFRTTDEIEIGGAHTPLWTQGMRHLLTARDADTDRPIVKTERDVDTMTIEDVMTGREKNRTNFLDISLIHIEAK